MTEDHADILYRLAIKTARNKFKITAIEELEELAQGVVLKILESKSYSDNRYVPDSKIYFLIIDLFREKNSGCGQYSKNKLALPSFTEIYEDTVIDVATEHQIHSKMDLDLMENELNSREKAVISFLRKDDLYLNEIAERLKVTPAVITTTFQSAIRKMKSVYECNPIVNSDI